jgi:hypothetical protein
MLKKLFYRSRKIKPENNKRILIIQQKRREETSRLGKIKKALLS